MRSMALEFTSDPACAYLDRQYMMGDCLLVAPIFNDQGIAEYYLPQGRWTNYLTDEEIQGGSWRREKHGYLSIPLMVRENTILPTSAGVSRTDAPYADHLLLKAYNIKDQAHTEVYQGQEKVAEVTVTKNGNTVVVHSNAQQSYRLQFINQTAVSADHALLEQEGASCVVTVEKGAQQIVVRMA